MRSAPPVSIDIHAAPHWRAVIVLLCAAAVGLTAAWALDRLDADRSPIAWAVVLVPLGAIALAWRALAAAATARGRLRWDGEQWWFAPHGGPLDAEAQVGVAVQLDLGAWMLVQARCHGAAPGARRSVWLPLQRSAVGANWLALRRALFAARPTAAGRTTRPAVEELRDER